MVYYIRFLPYHCYCYRLSLSSFSAWNVNICLRFCIGRPMAKWPNGQMERWTDGQMDRRMGTTQDNAMDYPQCSLSLLLALRYDTMPMPNPINPSIYSTLGKKGKREKNENVCTIVNSVVTQNKPESKQVKKPKRPPCNEIK